MYPYWVVADRRAMLDLAIAPDAINPLEKPGIGLQTAIDQIAARRFRRFSACWPPPAPSCVPTNHEKNMAKYVYSPNLTESNYLARFLPNHEGASRLCVRKREAMAPRLRSWR